MITIEQLAEELKGNLWTKGDLKRIYLDKGWNTKKMSTKTFVWQDENGDFKVSCRIECPSQGYQWIKSQEDKVKESVYEHIEEILAEKVFIIVNKDGGICNDVGNLVELNDYDVMVYYSKEKAEYYLKNEALSGMSYKEMDKEDFLAEVERLDEIERNKHQEKAEVKPLSNPEPAKKDVEKTVSEDNLTIEKRIKHFRFGVGTIIEDLGETTKILFDDTNIGERVLIKKFAKLEVLENEN